MSFCKSKKMEKGVLIFWLFSNILIQNLSKNLFYLMDVIKNMSLKFKINNNNYKINKF